LPLFAILTLFPEAIEPYTRASILGVAEEKGLARTLLVDFRDFARDRHRTVDDRPYGGGPGMVLKPEPVIECVEWLERRHGRFRKLLMCPTGTPFAQPHAESLAREERVMLLAGRYEGFDERIRQHLELEPFSVGDFVLAGGEIPALAILEAVVRLVPGVLGDERSALEDSFRRDEAGDGILDHPHYPASTAELPCRRSCCPATTRRSVAGASAPPRRRLAPAGPTCGAGLRLARTPNRTPESHRGSRGTPCT
jgi:tRNA (guanine37-N1)-methyltransferase